METPSSPNQQPSPEYDHLLEEDRLALATGIYAKELSKLHGIEPSDTGAPFGFAIDRLGLVDFWNRFAALIEGMELKSSFTMWVTAQNVRWVRQQIPITALQMTSFLDQLHRVPGITPRNDIHFSELAATFAGNPGVAHEQLRTISQHNPNPSQDTYPIIARKTDQGLFKVLDGNRRTLKATLLQRPTMDAWIGELHGTQPEDYWVPLNDLYQRLKGFRQACDRGDRYAQDMHACLLQQDIFAHSQVAERAYLDYIAPQSEAAAQLYELARAYRSV